MSFIIYLFMDYEPPHDPAVRLNNQRTAELYCQDLKLPTASSTKIDIPILVVKLFGCTCVYI